MANNNRALIAARRSQKMRQRKTKPLTGRIVSRLPRAKTRHRTPSSRPAVFPRSAKSIKTDPDGKLDWRLEQDCTADDADVDTSFDQSFDHDGEETDGRVWFKVEEEGVYQVRIKDEDMDDDDVRIERKEDDRVWFKVEEGVYHVQIKDEDMDDDDDDDDVPMEMEEDDAQIKTEENVESESDAESECQCPKCYDPGAPIHTQVSQNADNRQQRKIYVEIDEYTVDIILDEAIYFIRGKSGRAYSLTLRAKLGKILAYWTALHLTTDWPYLMDLLQANVKRRVEAQLEYCSDWSDAEEERGGESDEDFWTRECYEYISIMLNDKEMYFGQNAVVVGSSNNGVVQSEKLTWCIAPNSPPSDKGDDDDDDDDDGDEEDED